MDPGQHSGLARKRADRIDVASITTHPLVEDADAEGLLLKIFECLGDREVTGLRVFLFDLRFDFFAKCTDGGSTLDLGWLVESRLDAVARNLMASDDLAGVVKVVKGSVSIPPHPDDWKRLTEGATVAITGFGG